VREAHEKLKVIMEFTLVLSLWLIKASWGRHTHTHTHRITQIIFANLLWLENKSFCFKIMFCCDFNISFKYRWEVLMCYTATMPMEKRMKIFRGEAIGCLNREYGDIFYFLISQYINISHGSTMPSFQVLH
jgi:hypothetical protein